MRKETTRMHLYALEFRRHANRKTSVIRKNAMALSVLTPASVDRRRCRRSKLERRTVMKKLYVIATVAAMLIGATLLLERIPTVAAAQSGIKNVVLVHGAF